MELKLEKPDTLRDLIAMCVQYEQFTTMLEGNVAGHLFDFAKKTGNKDKFLDACALEETWVKSSDAGDARVTKLPKCWQQAKSDIKGAWERGCDPKNYPTYSKMKAAKVEAGKADKPKPAATPADGKPGRAKNDPRNDRPPADDDAVPAVTRDEALESGEVVYANATQIIPDWLLKTAKFLDNIPDSPFRAKAIKNVEAAAKQAHDLYFANNRAGNKQRGKQAVAA